MGKGGRSHLKKEKKNAKRTSNYGDVLASEDMDDEIDAFHKQRDIVPLDINDDGGDSDEDYEHPIFGFEGIDDDEDDDDDANNTVAKIKRQSKYLRSKFGEPEDEMHLDDDEEEDQKHIFGGRKSQYGADNRDFELQSSDDDAPKEEELAAIQIRKDITKSLTMADYGLVDTSEDEIDRDLTLKEASVEEKDKAKWPDVTGITYKEDDMNILHGSASELCHWLSELKVAHEQLECKINPLLVKVKNGEIAMEGGVQYFEMKQLVLLSYCQAITFYLLLKSEGQPVRDHPVIARLEEVKKLLDQIKQLDEKLPFQLEEILTRNHALGTRVESDNDNPPTPTNDQEHTVVSAQLLEAAVPQQAVETQKMEPTNDFVNKPRKHKHQKDHIGMQSLEMFKVRASLEEKLKQKGLYGLIAPKPSSALKRSRPVNGRLETYDDFNDDAADVEEADRLGRSVGSSKISQFLNTNKKKPKVISGDDDLPKRDDIGERRRKHELRVLAGAGIKSEDYVEDEISDLGTDEAAEDDDDDSAGEGSEDELYKQVKEQRAAKLAAKAEIYSRNSSVPSLPETVEGKRVISLQMEKNKGLTPKRKKLTKNPRKKYKLKHQKAVKNRQGQVRNIRKATGPYGGEASGINAGISRSIRFKG
ncbi:hypothetical protein L6164_033388 [Bauhinia variegata]|uniref:Uncharacterized protein n=1 Tax=Bauhinia variegata TaxID=167791 RepID=A0ACB9KRX9_BAUVA|nr:hypothetical protein L6164_033388 [Bauhinia variegata]